MADSLCRLRYFWFGLAALAAMSAVPAQCIGCLHVDAAECGLHGRLLL